MLAFYRSFAFDPDWASLDARPLPPWYDGAKVGIFMHFGPYAVPGFSSAWFWNAWHEGRPGTVEFMKDNYPPDFTYQDFGPELKMEFFNASQFAQLVKDSGAKLVPKCIPNRVEILFWIFGLYMSWQSCHSSGSMVWTIS